MKASPSAWRAFGRRLRMAARMGSSETLWLSGAGAGLAAGLAVALLAALRGALGAVLMATWESDPLIGVSANTQEAGRCNQARVAAGPLTQEFQRNPVSLRAITRRWISLVPS